MEGGQRHAPAALPPRKTRYLLYRRQGKTQSRSGWMRKMSPTPGFDPRTVQPVAIPRRFNSPLSWKEENECDSLVVFLPLISENTYGGKEHQNVIKAAY